MVENPWKYPDWIYTVRRKLEAITLDRFSSRISLQWKVIAPEKNVFAPGKWALRLKALFVGKNRDTGAPITIQGGDGNGIYLYSAENCEQIVYAEIEKLVKHELLECFHIKEGKNRCIIFDPHRKSFEVSGSIERKINSYRLYPSLLTKMWLTNKRDFLTEWQLFADTPFKYLIEYILAPIGALLIAFNLLLGSFAVFCSLLSMPNAIDHTGGLFAYFCILIFITIYQVLQQRNADGTANTLFS